MEALEIETQLGKVIDRLDAEESVTVFRVENQTDTEMLLDDLEVEFKEKQVRIEEVHKRAKSLLKINR